MVAGLVPVKRALGLDAWSGAEIGLTATVVSLALMVLGSLIFPDRKEG